MRNLPHTNKTLGQHWLHDEYYLHLIADESGVGELDTVVEIGPGPGGLTEVLAPKVKRLIAVEFDAHLANELHIKVPAKNIEVVNEDVLKYDFSSVGEPYSVVANIPYYLTARLIRILLTSPSPPLAITLLIQKEVAERLAASPGKMSILSVSAQLYTDVLLSEVVPPTAFTPPPKVESQVVHMKLRSKPLFDDVDNAELMRLVKFGFGEKRKKLSNTVSAGLQVDKQLIADAISAVGLGEKVRAQELSLEQWRDLFVYLQEKQLV